MSLVLFLFSYQTCFSVSHAAITRYVLQDLWTTTMYHVYYDQINAMVVTTICCFCLCDDTEKTEVKVEYISICISVVMRSLGEYCDSFIYMSCK